MDHGYAVDEDKRCSATSQKARPCANQALTGIDRCALHAGLARAKGAPGYGDPRALEEYKRRRLAPAGARAQTGAGGNRQASGYPR